MNNELKYPALHSDTVTILCDETGPVITVLQGKASCELTLDAKDLALRHSYKPVLR